MEQSVSRQCAELATALLVGGGLGAALDMLRIFVRCRSRAVCLLSDCLYLLLAGAVLFWSAQRSGAGGRLFFLAAAALGCGLYFVSLSPYVTPCLKKISDTFDNLYQFMGKKGKKVVFFLKKNLSKR